MTNYIHTPGNWKIGKAPSGQVCILSPGTWICGQLLNPGMPVEEAMANALLISKAPAMLAELLQCEKDLEFMHKASIANGGWSTSTFTPAMRVRALIDLTATVKP